MTEPAFQPVRPLSSRERDRVEALVCRQVWLKTRIASPRPGDSANKVNWWVREESALGWVIRCVLGEGKPGVQAATAAPADDLTAAMSSIADLLAETLALEGHSPALDAARQKARNLLREWSARR